MALILVGMDEAGYGPLLGPMCVASSTWRIEGWEPGGRAPDLWSLLSTSVCRKPEAGGRIAVADSKKLKLANDREKASGPRGESGPEDRCAEGGSGAARRAVTKGRPGRHPLVHLERGVLAIMDGLGRACETDEALITALGGRVGCHACYGGAGIELPLCATKEARGIAANLLRLAMSERTAVATDLWCETVDELAFNAIVERTGNKGEVSVEAFGRLVARAVRAFAGAAREGDCLKIVCDRLGGRASYGDILARWFPGCEDGEVVVVHESETLSRYAVRHGGHEIGVSFEVGSESRHLPIACASMTAKYVRELCMQRFNRYWGERFPEIKPTAGYWQDAKRWLAETRHLIENEDRAALVRRA